MKKFVAVAFCFAFALQCARLQADVILEVAAGKHDRGGTLVSVTLPESAIDFRVPNLVRIDTGAVVPVSFDRLERQAVWILDETLPAGKTWRYRFGQLNRNEPDIGGVDLKDNGKRIFMSVRGKPVLAYNSAVVPAPNRKEAYYDRSGHIHPLFNPSGQVVTDDFAPDHQHQHGIMFPWTNTTYECRNINFWDQKSRQATVRHVGTSSAGSDTIFGEFTAALDHIDLSAPGKPKVALHETWRVRVYNQTDGFLFDIESRQRAASSPLRINKYHYGAFAIRGHRNWLKPGQGDFLTSEGKTRKDGNHTRPNWVEIHGNVDGKPTGVTIFSHPTNFRAPQPVRLHPNKPYFCFAPMVLGAFEITSKQEYVSRYRFFVHDDKLDVNVAERVWRDFAEPPTVTIVD
jgi:hypothetical protein